MTGAAGARPVLVYRRIDANRRRTRRLLTAFAVALLPIVSAGATFIFPFIHIMYVLMNPTATASMAPTSLLWLNGGFFLLI